MRRAKAFLAVLLILAGAAVFWQLDMKVMKLEGKELQKPQGMEHEMEKVKTRLEDAALIQKAFAAVGVLGVLEGREEYKQTLEEENWYSYRSIRMEWNYRFAIAANLEEISVKVENGLVNIGIDKSKLYIWFLEKTEDSTSSSYASMFAKKFNSHEVEVLEKAVSQKVDEKIKSTDAYWNEAEKSLERNLLKICNDLGYNNIYFSVKER